MIDAAEIAVLQSGAWTSFVTNGGTALAKLGINATADTTNRLAVGADASLFTNVGSSHRMKINKATAGDTASITYEDALSGRAEVGLTGDDAFHVKVSPNGSTWFEALNIAQASGLVTLPIGQLAFPATQNPSSGANTLDDYEEGTWTPQLQFNTGVVGITYSAVLGRYTKIGRMVNATCNIVLTSKGTSTGVAQIAGFPFVAANDGIYSSAAVGIATNMTSVVGAVLCVLAPNTQKVTVYHSNNGAGVNLTNSNFGATTQILFTLCYETA